jgi:flagellar protein FliO/FliZ
MDSVSFFWSFLKMLSALALVIGLMIAALVVIKKYFYHSPAVSGGNTMIDIISTHHLGPKNSFILVDVLGQVLLLGISNQEISLLTTITDPDALDKLKSLRFRKDAPSTPDPFLWRYKSLLKTIGRVRKDR